MELYLHYSESMHTETWVAEKQLVNTTYNISTYFTSGQSQCSTLFQYLSTIYL